MRFFLYITLSRTLCGIGNKLGIVLVEIKEHFFLLVFPLGFYTVSIEIFLLFRNTFVMQEIPPFLTGHIFGNMLIFGNTMFNLESVLIGIHIFGLACCLVFLDKLPVLF